ncbi:MAG TPA: SulP family inorganic anion transporter [Anaerolineales bacterium]|nr:SulP family inorganic anion transporter [Anaerolineales bacterium]
MNKPLHPAKLRSLLNAETLLPDFASGLVAGMIEVVVAISLVSLVFSGSLSGFLPRALGLSLVGASILITVVGLTSSYPTTYASLQDAPSAILALATLEIARNMAGNSPPESVFSTVVVSIGLTTLIAGVCFLVIGRLRLGLLVRYLPYPVVGGFLAGTGWVLALGGLGIMSDTQMVITNLHLLFLPELLSHWVPGLLFAVILTVLLSRSKHILIFPGVIVAAIALFYLFAQLSGTSISELSQAGWLMGPFPQGKLWQPLSLTEFNGTNWSQIFSQAGSLGTAVLLSVLAMLLNTSGLELILEKDLDMEQELQSAGYANVIASFFGSLIGYHRISSTSLLVKLGARSRLSLVFTSLVCLGALFFGATYLTLIPKLVVGGLLLTLGFDFLIQWVYKTWFQLPRIDWLIILIILATIATIGFLEGVAVGTIAAIIMFAVSYSRVNIIKRTITGTVYHSTKTRSRSQRRKLVEIGKRIAIIELQGFIFFGTASQILAAIKAHLEEINERCYLILDFTRVSGIDSSVTHGFNKIKLLAKENGTNLVFTGLSTYLTHQIEKAGILADSTSRIIIFNHLDEGVEYCENQLLDESGLQLSHTLPEQLAQIINNPEQINNLMGYLDKMVLQAGEVLIREGEPADDLYLVESGQVTAQLERPGRKSIVLQTMIGENVVGEVGVYSGLPRTATIVVDQPTTVYRLSLQALKQMESEAPETAIFFHKLMGNLMAERVAHMTRVAEGLK